MDAKLAEKADLARRSEVELARNKDFSANLYDLEAKHRMADDNLAVSRREQEELRFSNQSLAARNADVSGQIDALRHHCGVLDGQNRHLNQELERFVETDEQIRCTLNRRDRVNELRARTDYEVRASAHYVESSSPARRHSPFRHY